MELIGYESDNGVAVLTLDHPPVNAFSMAVWKRLTQLLNDISSDPTIVVGILTAAGTKAFSAGADVKEAAQLGPEMRRQRTELVTEGLKTLYTTRLPIICAINAAASGGGVNIAALCDYRIASDQAHFSLPEIKHGARAGGGAFLRRIGVPTGAVRAMIYTGGRIKADEALAIHLVDEVVPPTRVLVRAHEVAADMSVHGRGALISMKAAALAAEADLKLFDAYDRANQSST